MKQRVERRLAAIVSADLTGYGLMMEADEEAAHLRTGALMGEVVQQAEAFGGSVINVAGDGVLSEFPSPVNAVRFSLAVLRVSQQHNKRRPRQKALAFRVGVHAGDIVVDDGRIGGDNINIAVRIEQVAEPQSVLVSGAVYEQVRRTLPVAFEYVGQPQLKHVSRPIELYRVLGGRKAAATLAGKTRAPVRLATATGPSIAVLPFENLNPDRDNGFFIDGITDDIITALSRFRSLSVIGRESSFKFRSEQLTPSEVAKRLGVRYLLSGSIRSADHRIRLNAQLVDTSLGRTVWAERYDSTLSDLLGIEAGVVQMIVARLAGQVEGAERARLRSEETSDLEAYGYQLRGAVVERDPEEQPARAQAVPAGAAAGSELRARLCRTLADPQSGLALQLGAGPGRRAGDCGGAGQGCRRKGPDRRPRPRRACLRLSLPEVYRLVGARIPRGPRAEPERCGRDGRLCGRAGLRQASGGGDRVDGAGHAPQPDLPRPVLLAPGRRVLGLGPLRGCGRDHPDDA
jgi:TolB-like protein